jgi:hypothetical protein
MRCSIVRSLVASAVSSSNDVIGSQWVVLAARQAADPAGLLLGQHLGSGSAMVRTEAALRGCASASLVRALVTRAAATSSRCAAVETGAQRGHCWFALAICFLAFASAPATVAAGGFGLNVTGGCSALLGTCPTGLSAILIHLLQGRH